VIPNHQSGNDMQPLNEQLFDPKALEKTLEESDPDILISFYQIFMDHTLSSWQAAETAANSGGWSEVSALAHSIKSSSRSIGALSLSALMSDIEKITTNGSAALNEVKSASQLVRRTRLAIVEHIAILQDNTSTR
jgi:HPt (histidine-containing phosphotransfer) domain-containing protein